MAKKNWKTAGRRGVCLLLTLIMAVSMLNLTALAAEPAPELVRNYTDAYYKQDGTPGTAEDWEVHLSKQAAVTDEENVFDITLTVETKDTSVQLGGATHGAATLVLDVSNSMNYRHDGCTVDGCGQDEGHPLHHKYEEANFFLVPLGFCRHCYRDEKAHEGGHAYIADSDTHLENLQAAVAAFLDSYAAEVAQGDKRMISVAVFGTEAVTIQGWVDVTDAAARREVEELVNSLRTGDGAYLGRRYLTEGGTNIEAGLALGRNLLNDSRALEGILPENQSLILFSDGNPTARIDSVNDSSVERIGYGGRDTGTQTDREDYDDIDRILADISATTIAVKYNFEDTYKVLDGFDRVINSTADSLSVDLEGEAGKVVTTATTPTTITDPMGDGVIMIEGGEYYQDETWSLAGFTPVVADGITTYTITYQVELDPTAVDADPDYAGFTILAPANGTTTLNYTVGEQALPVEAEFNVPDIRGILPRHTLTVNYVDETGKAIAEPIVETDIVYGSKYDTDQKEIAHYSFDALAQGSHAASGIITEDVVVTYVYSATYYHVTYEYTGQVPEQAPELPLSSEYTFGTPVTVAEEPALEGYTFSGWDREDFLMPGEDVVITGSWTPIPKYSVTYEYIDAPEGAPELPAAAEYEAGAKVAVAVAPTLEGYTFSGWDRGDFLMPAEAVVIQGTWTAIPKYSVTYEYINAPEGAPALPAAAEYEAGAQVTVAAAPTLEGYTFSGWDRENFTMPAEAVVIQGSWTIIPPNKYNVVYQYEGEIPEGAPALPGEEQYEAGAQVVVAEAPALEGYTFSGWDKEDFTMPAETVVIKGAWTPLPRYTVTYEYIDAPEDAPALPEQAEYLAGAAVTVAAAPALAGYTFSGWDKENFTMPAEAVVIRGSWIKDPDPKYPVSYEYTGTVPADAPALPATAEYEAGIEVIVAEAPALEGYTFSGWDKENFTMPAEAVVIKGTWTKNPDPKYTVTYVYEGDIPETAPALPATAEYEAGIEVIVAEAPAVEGYIFSGWDKEKFTMPAEAVVIKGTWTKKAAPPPVIVEEAEGQFVITFDKAVAGDSYRLHGKDFTFQLSDAPRFDMGNGRYVLGENSVVARTAYTAQNEADGSVTFTVPFIKDLSGWDKTGYTATGSFVYTLSEVAGEIPGMTFSQEQYTILVELLFTEQGKGWTYTIDSVLIEGEAVTAEIDGSVIKLSLGENALYTNTYDDGLGELIINKTILGKAKVSEDLGFRIVGPEDYEEFVLYTQFEDGAYTLDGLQPGTYTVTEENAAVSGYRLKATGEGEVEVTGSQAAEIEIINTYTKRSPYVPHVNPTPDPVTPDPVDPVTPDPVDPVTPDPVDPVTPDPVEIPDEEVPLVDIPDEEVPLVDIPDEEVPLVDIPDEEVPLADIPETEVPLADVPKTGDEIMIGLLVTMLAGVGLIGLLATGKKRKEAF